MSAGSVTPVMTTTGRRSPSRASWSAAATPVWPGSWMSKSVDVGLGCSRQRDGLLAVRGRAKRLVSELTQALGKRERDDRLVLGDQDSQPAHLGKATSRAGATGSTNFRGRALLEYSGPAALIGFVAALVATGGPSYSLPAVLPPLPRADRRHARQGRRPRGPELAPPPDQQEESMKHLRKTVTGLVAAMTAAAIAASFAPVVGAASGGTVVKVAAPPLGRVLVDSRGERPESVQRRPVVGESRPAGNQVRHVSAGPPAGPLLHYVVAPSTILVAGAGPASSKYHYDYYSVVPTIWSRYFLLNFIGRRIVRRARAARTGADGSVATPPTWSTPSPALGADRDRACRRSCSSS